MNKYVIPFFLLTVLACGANKKAPITEQELGESWPLTETRGYLLCDPEKSAIAFVTESGTIYSLNGVAQSAWRSAEDIKPIWKPEIRNGKATGDYKDLSLLMKRARELCGIKG